VNRRRIGRVGRATVIVTWNRAACKRRSACVDIRPSPMTDVYLLLFFPYFSFLCARLSLLSARKYTVSNRSTEEQAVNIPLRRGASKRPSTLSSSNSVCVRSSFRCRRWIVEILVTKFALSLCRRTVDMHVNTSTVVTEICTQSGLELKQLFFCQDK